MIEYQAKKTEKSIILTNGTERLMIHRSKYYQPNSKYTKYCLKDIKTMKHLTGLFTETSSLSFPNQYIYYQNNIKYVIEIKENIAYKFIENKQNSSC
jgi:hypothetical protein